MKLKSAEDKNNALSIVMKYMAMVMTLVYICMGLALIIKSNELFNIPKSYALPLGSILIVYGVFRGYRAIKSILSDDMKQDSLVILAVLLLCSCTVRDRSGHRIDTPTAGYIRIAVDESLHPLIDAELYAFKGIYKNANIDATYTTEQEAVDLLLKDSVRLIVITRPLSEEETAVLHQQQIQPHQVSIAKSGIALITHPENKDSLMTTQNLSEILSGRVSEWKQLHSGSTGVVSVVFDQPNSGIIRQLQDSLNLPFSSSNNCFALKGNTAVVDYVSQNKSALGLIDVSWISDRDDSTANVFLKTVKVVGVAADSNYYQPYQAYIAQNLYPLTRNIFMVSREARAGLASGFIAFTASDKGQRVVLKAGLVPVTMPVRIVEVNNQSLE